MINAEQCFINCIKSLVRRVKGRVELYEGSTLLQTFAPGDNLRSFSIERTGEDGKFFGFGVGQKLTVKLIDKERVINITPDHTLEAVFGTGCDYIYTNPLFYVENVERDENTNELTITAYDALNQATKHTVSELGVINASYNIEQFAGACAALLGLPLKLPEANESFKNYYAEGANFDGTETVREALNAIAEATQTIYFIDYDWNLSFKQLDKTGEAVDTISKDRYFTLKSEVSKTLGGIAHITELGDNVEAIILDDGVTQYVRNNPFGDMRDDVGDLLQEAAINVSGITISQFDVSWRGNYLIEIGDKIELENKDGSVITAYVLSDVITYDGGLKQSNSWSYTNKEVETPSNPVTLGAALVQTSARVDKANKKIELVASETTANAEAISTLQMNTESINAAVKQMEETTTNAFNGVNEEIATLTNKVEATMTSEEIIFSIQSELSNGVGKVETETGFTFNNEGLTVSKSGSDITTTITEDGMKVYRNEEAVLVADNEGVKAEDLHATTYLIIGSNSRFEDYGSDRTGCFWIGS